jgi:hypothetical protein
VRPAFTTCAGSAARPAAYPRVRPPVRKSSAHMSVDCAGGAGFSNNTEAQAQRRRLPHTVRGALAPMPAIKSCRNSYRVPLLTDACRRCWLPSPALRGTGDLAR